MRGPPSPPSWGELLEESYLLQSSRFSFNNRGTKQRKFTGYVVIL